MSTGDRITILVAAGAISATLGIGSCSTNARIDDVNTRLDTRIDDVQADIRELRALVIEALEPSVRAASRTMTTSDPTASPSSASPLPRWSVTSSSRQMARHDSSGFGIR